MRKPSIVTNFTSGSSVPSAGIDMGVDNVDGTVVGGGTGGSHCGGIGGDMGGTMGGTTGDFIGGCVGFGGDICHVSVPVTNGIRPPMQA